MAFQDVVTQQKFYKLSTRQGALTEEGEKLLNQTLAEGHLTRQIDGQWGPQYEIRDPARGLVVLGGGQLKAAFANGFIGVGDYVKITFLGMEELTQGANKGTWMKKYQLQVDPDRRLATDAVASALVADGEVAANAPSEESLAQATEAVHAATIAASQTIESPQLSTSDVLAKYKK